MKRSESLTEIKWCGFHGDTKKAAEIAAQKGIGKAAVRTAYRNGAKIKDWGEPCGCAKCTQIWVGGNMLSIIFGLLIMIALFFIVVYITNNKNYWKFKRGIKRK